MKHEVLHYFPKTGTMYTGV